MESRPDRAEIFIRGLIAGAFVGAIIAGSSAWGRHRPGRTANGGDAAGAARGPRDTRRAAGGGPASGPPQR